MTYMANDIKCDADGRSVLVKLSNDISNIRTEFDILKKLSRSECKDVFPTIYGAGEFRLKNPPCEK